jgi:hypothetical protein
VGGGARTRIPVYSSDLLVLYFSLRLRSRRRLSSAPGARSNRDFCDIFEAGLTWTASRSMAPGEAATRHGVRPRIFQPPHRASPRASTRRGSRTPRGSRPVDSPASAAVVGKSTAHDAGRGARRRRTISRRAVGPASSGLGRGGQGGSPSSAEDGGYCTKRR